MSPKEKILMVHVKYSEREGGMKGWDRVRVRMIEREREREREK